MLPLPGATTQIYGLDLVKPTGTSIRRIVYVQNNLIYGNNKQLTIFNGPGAQTHAPGRKIFGSRFDKPDTRDQTSGWHRRLGSSLGPTVTDIIYEQTNRIYGDNTELTIFNGLATGETIFGEETNKKVSGSDRVPTYQPMMYEQNNWIYGDNQHLDIYNGTETEAGVRHRGTLGNLQNNWIFGSNQQLTAHNGRSGGDVYIETEPPIVEVNPPRAAASHDRARTLKRTIEDSHLPRKRIALTTTDNTPRRDGGKEGCTEGQIDDGFLGGLSGGGGRIRKNVTERKHHR